MLCNFDVFIERRWDCLQINQGESRGVTICDDIRSYETVTGGDFRKSEMGLTKV